MNTTQRPAGREDKDGTHPSPARAGVFVGTPTISAGISRPSTRIAFLQDAFRPFYLGGAVFAALAIPFWLAMWRGYLPAVSPAPLLWHAHEMVYGFATAIIIGFLFTAARNWTGLPLPGGVVLGGLFGVWAAGRVGMAMWYGVATAVIDIGLLLVVATVLAFNFIRAGSLRSLPLVGVLLCLVVTNGAFHGAMLAGLEISPLRAVHAGVMCVVVVELIVGGRIVPAFTASGIPGVKQRRSPRFELTVRLIAAAAFAADLLWLAAPVRGWLAIAAAVGLVAQLIGWNPSAARARPILWILHVSYAWIPVACSCWAWPPSNAFHVPLPFMHFRSAPWAGSSSA